MAINVLGAGLHPQPIETPSEETDPLDDYAKFYRGWAEGREHSATASTNPAGGNIETSSITPDTHPELEHAQPGETAEERLRKDGISMVGRGYQNIAHNEIGPRDPLKTRYKELGMLQSALVPDAISMNVPYMNSQEREQYRLSSSEGVLRNRSGQPLDTGDGSHLIVMDKKGRMYAGPSSEVTRHSSFLAGNPVAAAGLIQAKSGKVTQLLNESGHYQVPKDYFAQLGKELKRKGIEVAPDATQDVPARLTSKQIAKKLNKKYGNEPDVTEHSSSVTNAQIPVGKHKPGQRQRLYPTGPKWNWF